MTTLSIGDLRWIYELWQIPSVKAAIVTVILGILIDIGRRVVVPRGRVAWGISNNEYFILPAQPPAQPTAINVLTRQIFVQNVGRAVAEDVEVTINFLPQHWHAFPPILQIMPNTQDRFLRLQTKMLNRREYFIISMFNAQTATPGVQTLLPDVNTVRWKGGVARQVALVPQQQLPTWRARLLVAAMYFGFISALFIILRFAFFIF